ncbi:MAG: APC family permease, partial [Myxococcota bacterium]
MDAAAAKHLDRELGLFSVFSISMGAMMSSGIFVLPLIAALEVGPGVAAAYLLAGVAVIPAVLTKAELASAMPIAGGTYIYVDRSMGPWVGTITGLGTWLSLVAKTSFALVGLGAYLQLFSSISTLPLAIVMLLGLIGLNLLGASRASFVQRLIVLACLVALAGFAAGGYPTMKPENLEPLFTHGWQGVVAGAGLVIVSYAGVTKVCSVAEEVHRPEVNLPAGMILAQVTAMIIYTIVATVITGNLDLATFAGAHGHDGHPPAELLTPVATAAEAFWGRPGVVAMAITAA